MAILLLLPSHPNSCLQSAGTPQLPAFQPAWQGALVAPGAFANPICHSPFLSSSEVPLRRRIFWKWLYISVPAGMYFPKTKVGR